MDKIVEQTAKSTVSTSKIVLMGNRIPKDYFITKGSSDTTKGQAPSDPSYTLALENAGLGGYNIMEYNSVLPPDAIEISKVEAGKYQHHGAITEAIMAHISGVKGQILCSGIGRVWVRRISDNQLMGGFTTSYESVHEACELTVAGARQKAKEALNLSLFELMHRRYSAAKYDFLNETFDLNCFKVKNCLGTSLTALAWVNYIYPIFGESSRQMNS